jgi:hypothetical protein
MPYKDEEKQREYQREWQRMKKAGEGKTPGRTLNPEQIKTAQGLLQLLADVMAEIRGTEADPFIRARCIGYLAAIALKTVETADLEQRITKLEENTNIKH